MKKTSKTTAAADKQPAQSTLIDIDVIKMARVVSAIRGGGAGKLISTLAREPLRKMVRELTESGELTSE